MSAALKASYPPRDVFNAAAADAPDRDAPRGPTSLRRRRTRGRKRRAAARAPWRRPPLWLPADAGAETAASQVIPISLSEEETRKRKRKKKGGAGTDTAAKAFL